MNIRELQDKILELKKEKDFCILAHVYENREIVEIADYIGDSFALSQQAAKAPQKNVIMCGVRFMAETVKLLSPDKHVYLSNSEAGCPMAEQLDVEMLKALKAQNPTILLWRISIPHLSLKPSVMYALHLPPLLIYLKRLITIKFCLFPT